MTTKNDVPCTGNDSSVHKSFKVLILGEIGVGKTTLIRTFLQKVETPEALYDGIFELYHARRIYKGNEVDIVFFDLYPGPKTPYRRECYPPNVDVVLLCFSIGQYSTLKSVFNLWIHEVRTHFGKLVPVFLVGLRSDLRFIEPSTYSSAHIYPEEDRLVEKCEAEIIHKNYHFHGEYMECSMYDPSSVIDLIKKVFNVSMEE